MPWNGSGTFNRIYSWVADKAAGLDISSTRTDADTNDIASSGFGNCLTRDGQGQPTADLPMANYRHTGVGSGVARTDYAAMAQAQDGLLGWTIAGGSADAITATYTPAHTVLSDGLLLCFRATAANATTTPTFKPDGLGAQTITRSGGGALYAGDIPGALAEVVVRYNLANTRFELLNPANPPALFSTGDIKPTLKNAADVGWLLFDDTTFGSASSGAGHADAGTQALFTLFFNNLTDSTAPLLTSSGGATTRAAQGSAAAAWAANCRMTLNKMLGRAIGAAGAGSGLTSRALGSIVGTETQTLVTSNLPPYTPAGTVATSTLNHTGDTTTGTGVNTGGSNVVPLNAVIPTITSTFTGTPQGGTSAAFSIIQPTAFLNFMVKL